jgi:hypothetical protein
MRHYWAAVSEIIDETKSEEIVCLAALQDASNLIRWDGIAATSHSSAVSIATYSSLDACDSKYVRPINISCCLSFRAALVAVFRLWLIARTMDSFCPAAIDVIPAEHPNPNVPCLPDIRLRSPPTLV